MLERRQASKTAHFCCRTALLLLLLLHGFTLHHHNQGQKVLLEHHHPLYKSYMKVLSKYQTSVYPYGFKISSILIFCEEGNAIDTIFKPLVANSSHSIAFGERLLGNPDVCKRDIPKKTSNKPPEIPFPTVPVVVI